MPDFRSTLAAGARAYDFPDARTPEKRDLMTDALTMSVNKNLVDVTTLLEWAVGAATPRDKLRHIRQALALMQDVEVQLQDLDEPPVMI